MSKSTEKNHSSIPLLAAAVTVILIIGAVALIALDMLADARGRHLENAPQPPLTRTLVTAGLLVMAVGWLTWLIKRYGIRHMLTIAATIVTAILLVITPVFAWQAFTSDRELTVISMTCDAEILRNTGVAPLTDCTEEAVETIVLLEGVESDDVWVPATTTNINREFVDLPGGSWKTMLTVDGPDDTVTVAAVAQNGDTNERLGNLRPYMDAESGRLRWSSKVTIDANISTVRVLFYLSNNPAVASASIRFDIRQCPGQIVRTFNAAQCESFEGSPGFIMEQSPDGPRTWRQPRVTLIGTTVEVTNLEARTYQLQPDYSSIELYTQSTDVLIIPSAMEQVEANSVTEPGQATFDVTIDENTGELSYVIYVFPAGPTYLSAPTTGDDEK